jgi:hypothetical protein
MDTPWRFEESVMSTATRQLIDVTARDPGARTVAEVIARDLTNVCQAFERHTISAERALGTAVGVYKWDQENPSLRGSAVLGILAAAILSFARELGIPLTEL